MGQNSMISSFFERRAKKSSVEGQSPPQELEVSPRSGLYLLVALKPKKILDKLETRYNVEFILLSCQHNV